MNKNQLLILSPTHVQQNDVLTIHTTTGVFRDTGYIIKNESGNVIRKGSIACNLLEFKLRIVGIKSGVYKFIMGDQQEIFQVV